uniref:Uncharacterized protein n=1 Tax=Anguilla anguilla TaxID=7936 RepID=A0A0E9QB41_ANGAN
MRTSRSPHTEDCQKNH